MGKLTGRMDKLEGKVGEDSAVLVCHECGQRFPVGPYIHAEYMAVSWRRKTGSTSPGRALPESESLFEHYNKTGHDPDAFIEEGTGLAWTSDELSPFPDLSGRFIEGD